MKSACETYANLGLPLPDEETKAAWNDSLREASCVPLFRRTHSEACCALLEIEPELAHALLKAAERFLASADLMSFGSFWWNRLKSMKPGSKLPRLPSEADWAPLFYALIFVSLAPEIQRFHESRGIATTVTRDTLNDLIFCLHEHKRLKGHWGLSKPEWLINHFTGRLYTLGRLQFVCDALSYEFHAYRERTTGRVLIFAGDDDFRADGQYQSSDGGKMPASFRSTFSDDGITIRGNPISPNGFVRAEQIERKSSEWSLVLKRGDPCLSIHIPALGPLDHAQCGASLTQAREFFHVHFPERTFKAFICSSWLLDPQLEKYLSPSSNIVRFMSEFYLFPVPFADGSQTIERVFEKFPGAGVAAQRKSALQTIIMRHIEGGGHWRRGGALYFPEDLAWGNRVYRQ